MTGQQVRVRELAGWDLDDDEYRPASFDPCKLVQARSLVLNRTPFQAANAVIEVLDAASDGLAEQMTRPDLHAEMTGLVWSVGIIDLRLLLAFQRRLILSPVAPEIPVPAADDWPALIGVSFGSPRAVACEVAHTESTILLRSINPNLHLRISDDASKPIALHGGSPFFEVAHYRGRWFLRDGYHRAYALLQAGVYRMPAVIVRARTLAELGATRPWFFPEEILFSSSPPRVTDFLDDALLLEYERPLLIKTLRVTMEEIFTPAAFSGENV